MPISDPDWPPEGYGGDNWPPPWLRYETEYPGSGRPSRLVAHADVPYSALIEGEEPLAPALTVVAGRYLGKLRYLLDQAAARAAAEGEASAVPPLLPPHWWEAEALRGGRSGLGILHWLDIWPPLEEGADLAEPPSLASWNLSREADRGLPAMVVMTAAEAYFPQRGVFSYSFGLRVPIAVQKDGDGLRATIRSLTAEFPAEGYLSWTEVTAAGDRSRADALLSSDGETFDPSILDRLAQYTGAAGYLDPETVLTDQWLFPTGQDGTGGRNKPRVTVVARGVGETPAAGADDPRERYTLRPTFPKPQSYQILSTFDLADLAATSGAVEAVGTQTCPLVTHAAGPGAAEVFDQTPPGWIDPAEPDADYVYTRRRPSRRDRILKTYRVRRKIGKAADKLLQTTGFEIRRCPEYVPADQGLGAGVKTATLPGGEAPLPRRNDFSALMAYCHADAFFGFLDHIGLPPQTFVVRAQPPLAIHYRYGIFPGPGRDGRTINAQVAFDCTEAAADKKPVIDMHLALANLNRWARPKRKGVAGHPDRRFLRPEPLGIASSGRWMLHEFGHYLTAARLGRLEFDFAHSAGDALAAVWYDPYSRLSDTAGGVDARFRGVTFPFVFSTRRHDRSALLGWAWYGALNRSVIAAPPSDCETLKGYLTEQILSSSIFRLYRALGGDTMRGDAADRYIRYRASFMTLFLLVRAVAGFAQSPSRAEMLELGMEEAGLLMSTPVAVPRPQGDAVSVPSGMPGDLWGGGVTHKVVRWAFEAQGMFVGDVLKTTNGPGRAPPVDIYIRDRRPRVERTEGGTTQLGAGSYTPVSLDWTGPRAWMVGNGFFIGNRGQQTAQTVRLRWWVGRLQGDMQAPRWDMGDHIDWQASGVKQVWQDVAAGGEHRFDPLAEMPPEPGAGQGQPRVILLECSCNDDLANSDPQALLASAIPVDAMPPVRPRSLTDLVAGDNNLGLMLILPN